MSAFSAIHGIVARDLSRALRQKGRLIGGIARPFMWLLVVGSGYQAVARVDAGGSYQEFLYPGVVAMAAVFGAMLTGVATVYDREFGMLRLMLASPAGTAAVLTGRVLAATVTGTLHGAIVLACAPLVIEVTPLQVMGALAALVFTALTSGVLGLLVAVRLQSVENFAGVFNVVLFPLLFVSGALYPVASLPGWLRAAALLNPMTYQVELLRGALGRPADIGVRACVLALLAIGAGGFVLALLLFDPERRFVGRPRPGPAR
jgi:ABC-2 type transport system permease protein